MLEIEYNFNDVVFVFNRELTDLEKTLNHNDLRNLECYIKDYVYVAPLTQKYTLDYLVEEGTKYQYEWYDSMGVSLLLNTKIYLISLNINLSDNLVYQMILSVERFIQKVWGKYDEYKTKTLNYEDFVCDYSEVGEPPCKLGDIKWVMDANYRALEPSRVVNMDINYYITWN